MVELFTLPGLAAAVATLVVMYMVSELFRCFLLPRKGSFKEKYPFECSVEFAQNNSTILDWICKLALTSEGKSRGMLGNSIVLNCLFVAPMVYTHEVENVTHILKNIEIYNKGGTLFQKLAPLLGNGVFNADGKQWFAHRKTSANLFKLEKFKTTMIDTFNLEMDKVMALIKATPTNFDGQLLMAKMTLESIGRIALGVDLGCLDHEHVPFAHYFDYCTKETNDSFINPLWYFRRYLSMNGWKYFYYIKLLDDICFKIIRARRQLLLDDPAAFHAKSDLLSLYLDKDDAVNGGEGVDKNSDTYLEPSDRNLRDVVLNIFIAGRDTTANALTWSLFRLGAEPDVQRKLREELTENREGCLAERGINYQTLQKLRYLEAFCMEVLRLHPSVPKEAKNVATDDTLPDGTKVKKGDLVLFSPYAMGRDTKLWGEDAVEFKPERFIEKPKPSPFVFTAFQAGPRICLGQNFAILEMKCALARILSQFEISLACDKDSVRYDNTLTLPVLGELRVTAIPKSI